MENNKETKDLPKKLPEMDKLIDLSVDGSITGRKITGSFKCRIPNGKMRAKADIKRAQLNMGVPENMLDPAVARYHFKLGYLYAALVESPIWWKESDFGYDLHDTNVVDDLYDQCIDFENNWMKEVWGEEKSSDEPRQ